MDDLAYSELRLIQILHPDKGMGFRLAKRGRNPLNEKGARFKLIRMVSTLLNGHGFPPFVLNLVDD